MLFIFTYLSFAANDSVSLKGIFTNTANHLYAICGEKENIQQVLLQRKMEILKEKRLSFLETKIKLIEEMAGKRFEISDLRQRLSQTSFSQIFSISDLLSRLATPKTRSTGMVVGGGIGVSASLSILGTGFGLHTNGEISHIDTETVRSTLPHDELRSGRHQLLEPYIKDIREIELLMCQYEQRLKSEYDYILELEKQYLGKKKHLPEGLQQQIEDELIASYDTDGQSAARSIRFLQEAIMWPTHVKTVILNPEMINNHEWMKTLKPEQQAEVWSILTAIQNNSRITGNHQISIFYIYGPPGSGKTKTVEMMLELLDLPYYQFNLIKGSKAFSLPSMIYGQPRKLPTGENGWFMRPFFQKDRRGQSYLNACLFLDDIEFDETVLQFFKQVSTSKEAECPYFGTSLDPRNLIVFMTSNQDIYQERQRFEAMISRINRSVSFPVGDQTKAQVKYNQNELNAYLKTFSEKTWSIWETQDFLDFVRFVMEQKQETIDHRSLLHRAKSLANSIYNPLLQFGIAKQEVKRLLDSYQESLKQKQSFSVFLGRLYRDGHFVDTHLDQAMEHFNRAIHHGRKEVSFDMGKLYTLANNLAKANEAYQQSYTFFQEQSEQQKCSDSTYQLGHMYEHGLGIDKNNEEALRWYSKAAEQMDSRAITAKTRLEQSPAEAVPQDVTTDSSEDFVDEEVDTEAVFLEQSDTEADEHVSLMVNSDNAGIQPGFLDYQHNNLVRWFYNRF